MDVQFMIMSIYIKEKNLVKILETINACKKLLEDGGDWERKNRLKVKKNEQLLSALYFQRKDRFR